MMSIARAQLPGCRTAVALGALVALALPAVARAGDAEAPTGFRAELLFELGHHEKRVLSLLEAFPQEKLSYKPAEDMKTAGELFVHMGGTAYFVGGLVGVERPKDVDPRALEKSLTEKSAIADYIKKGLEHARKVIGSVADKDLDETVKAPWGVSHSKRFLLSILSKHLISHVSQLGIYARSVGIVPPWVLAERKHRAELKTEKAAEKKE
jgi:hypothetical protein